MGRNPILERVIGLHASEGAEFADRTFGYGRDENDKIRTGAPLIISSSMEELREKDQYGRIKFMESTTKDGKPGPLQAYFPKDYHELINKINTGSVKVLGPDDKGNDVPYRMFAGHTTGNGSMLFMRDDDYKKIVEQDAKRGISSMLTYFNEVDQNGELIDPKTGRAYAYNDEDKLQAYARYSTPATKSFPTRNRLRTMVPIRRLPR